MVAALVTHPLDLAKARMQAAPTRSAGFAGTLVGVVRESGLRAVYDGLSASLLRQATYSTARFGAYERLKEAASTNGTTPSAAVLVPLSMVAGLIGSIVGNPADVTNVRMQNDKTRPLDQRRGYKNAFDGLFRIYKDEGPKALFRGIIPNAIRGMTMTASQAVSYDVAKDALVAAGMNPHGQGTFFTASMFAGLVATTACSPVDVIKTRVMNADVGESPIQALRATLKTEGPVFFFRGWLPAFIRLGPQTIVTFVVIEQLRTWKIGM